MGVGLGIVGQWLGGARAGAATFYFVGLAALVLAAREWGWVRFRLPERRCQTSKDWAHEFGFVMASAMWGAHIGLGFATRVTYGGFWILVAIVLAMGDPAYGVALMVVYWIGRALPVWMAPALLRSSSDAMELPGAILADRTLYHRLVGVTSVWAAGVAVLLALKGSIPWFAGLLGALP